MVTLRQLFETDNDRNITLEKKMIAKAGSLECNVPIRLHYDFFSAVMYVSLYLEDREVFSANDVLRSLVSGFSDVLLTEGVSNVILPGTRQQDIGLEIRMENHSPFRMVANPHDGSNAKDIDLTEFPFSGRLYVYCDDEKAISKELLEALDEGNYRTIVRGEKYREIVGRRMTPRAFISHDSRDKDDVARPLTEQLKSMTCHVWYDEYSLSVGDSLRESIEKGLKDCPYCIVILSSNFLSKGGWPKREYDSAFTREIIEDRNLILPVWHNVSKEEVFEYSPILANRFGLPYDDATATKLYRKLMSPSAAE